MSLENLDLEGLADAIALRLSEKLDFRGQCLLDRKDLAERLKVSQRGVTALVNRGELPPGIRIGGVRRWDWTEVLRFLAVRGKRKPRRGRGMHKR
jgi:hypothetical protein